LPGQSASAPDQSRVDCPLAPPRPAGSSMPAQTSPPPNSASFAFCASSRPSAVLSGRSPSKPVVRKIWGRKMPQVHARGIFLPQFFCPAVWETSPAARPSDSRYLRGPAAPREPRFEQEAREGRKGNATLRRRARAHRRAEPLAPSAPLRGNSALIRFRQIGHQEAHKAQKEWRVAVILSALGSRGQAFLLRLEARRHDGSQTMSMKR
jgi:hypothetical protein